jgi:acetyl esterase
MATDLQTDTGYRPAGPIDPLAAQIAAMFSVMPLSAIPLNMTRAALAAACAKTGEPAMWRSADYRVPVGGDETIALRLHHPSEHARAVIVWAHGGGFALGTIDEIDNFARALAARTGCAVASVGYRLAPEHRFPTAIEDVEAAVSWLSAEASQLGLDGLPLWLGGDSAGGNLATVVTRRMHARGQQRIAGNILVYPCTDSPDVKSLRHFTPPFMTATEVAFFIDQYLPDPALRTHPDFAPLHAEGLEVLPPTLVITAEHDIITEQAEAYAARLAALGVPVRIVRQPGMIHGFLTLDAFLPGAASAAIDDMGTFITQHPR